jgi:hypothetical protein
MGRGSAVRIPHWPGLIVLLLVLSGVLFPGAEVAVADEWVVFQTAEDCSCPGTEDFTPAHVDLGPGKLVCQWWPGNDRHYYITQHASAELARQEFRRRSGSDPESVGGRSVHTAVETTATGDSLYRAGGYVLDDVFLIQFGAWSRDSAADAMQLMDNFETCARAALARRMGSQQVTYHLYPGLLNEVEVGDKIQFSVITSSGAKVSGDKRDEFTWALVDCKSVSDYLGKETKIGSIDPKSGEFTAVGLGTCQVTLLHKDKALERASVTIACSQEPKGDLEKILKMYRDSIPSGPILEDVKTGKASAGLGRLLPGYANNMASISNGDRYGKFTCGGYQSQVLILLSRYIQADPKLCTLLNGYEYIPIYGSAGMHYTVAVFPEGTDWRNTAIVLDPWPTQRPATYTIDEWWARFPLMGETGLPGDAGRYSLEDKTVGAVHCPVNLRITDSSGRSLGVLDDGSVVHDIPDSGIAWIPDGEGGNLWYFELAADSSREYTLEMTGTSDGTFEVSIAGESRDSIQYYPEQSITEGATAAIVLDGDDELDALYMPDGTIIEPETSGELASLPGASGEESESSPSTGQTGGQAGTESGSAGPSGGRLCLTVVVCGLPFLLLMALILYLVRRRRRRTRTTAGIPGAQQALVPEQAAPRPYRPPAAPEPPPAIASLCSQCHAPVHAGARFCTKCGAGAATAKSPQGYYCSNCGTLNKPGASLCVRCGTRLPKGTASP